MKFTTTNNTTYRAGIGKVPKSWIECESENHKECIRKYFYRNIRLYDWDECGDETHDFLFDDDKAFRLEYSWWSEWYHEDDEKNGLKDQWVIEEIEPSEAKIPVGKVRDWI